MVTRRMERSQSTSFQQVEDWLRGLGLLQYAQSFYDNGYEEIDTCKEITQEDLDVIGVKSERDRDDIIIAVERLKQNLYFELEAPIIEKPEPVKFDPLVLKSKLKEELAKRNTQLIEPPYYFPDGKLGDLYPLAIQLADDLGTVFPDVLEGLEQLRKRQLPAQTYDELNELPEDGKERRSSTVSNQLLDPAEYLNCENPANAKNRGHSFSKYDTRVTKSTTDLTKDIHHERSSSAPYTGKYKIKNPGKPDDGKSSKSRFGSIFRKDTVKSNRGSLKEPHYEFKADELDLSQSELADMMTKVKSKEMSAEEVLAAVKKRTHSGGEVKSQQPSPNTTLERSDGSSSSTSITPTNSLGKNKKNKISKNMIKRSPSATFYTSKDDSTPYMIPPENKNNSLERKRSGSSMGGEDSQPDSTMSSPEMGKHGIISKIRSSMRKKGARNNHDHDHDDTHSLNQSGGSLSSQENLSISDEHPEKYSPGVKRHEPPPLPPNKPSKPVASNVYQDPVPIVPISNKPMPPPPRNSTLQKNEGDWEVFSEEGTSPSPSLKIKEYPQNQEQSNSNRKKSASGAGPLGVGRGLVLDLDAVKLKPTPRVQPRAPKPIPGTTTEDAKKPETPSTPKAPPRVKKSPGAMTPVTPISIAGIDDIGENMDNIIAGLDDRLHDIEDNYVDDSQLTNFETPREPVEKPKPVKKPSVTKRPMLPPKPPARESVTNTSVDKRVATRTFKPLPLKQILWKKLRSEGVQIHETPYTTNDGHWNVPQALINRYAEELNQSDVEIFNQMEILRKEKCSNARIPHISFSDSHKDAHKLTDNYSIDQWLIYHGLPMFVSDLQEVNVTSIEQINELKDNDFKSIGVYHDRHINLLKTAAKQHLEKSSIVFF
eukprot:TCONS_00014290-protein